MVNWESSLVELRLDRRPGNLQQREERVDECGTDSQMVRVVLAMFNFSRAFGLRSTISFQIVDKKNKSYERDEHAHLSIINYVKK